VIDVPIEPEAPLSEAQRQIVNAIDGRRTVADIVLESRSSAFNVSSTLYGLVSDGYVRLEEAGAHKAAAVIEEAPVVATVAAAAPSPSNEFNEDDEIVSLLNAAQTALRNRDYEKTQRLLKAAQNLDPNHPKIRTAIKGAETVILGQLRGEGIVDSKVPRVAKALEEITQMNFSPNEGFILSRINGQWDIGSLIKISPIRETDAMLIFYKLFRDGIIDFA
jgi:hypothetical protein